MGPYLFLPDRVALRLAHMSNLALIVQKGQLLRDDQVYRVHHFDQEGLENPVDLVCSTEYQFLKNSLIPLSTCSRSVARCIRDICRSKGLWIFGIGTPVEDKLEFVSNYKAVENELSIFQLVKFQILWCDPCRLLQRHGNANVSKRGHIFPRFEIPLSSSTTALVMIERLTMVKGRQASVAVKIPKVGIPIGQNPDSLNPEKLKSRTGQNSEGSKSCVGQNPE
ncbi:hypothetical protein M513_01967 [Trichuris suis]|uniref:Uncharacterized protein n=1 Tax=Trichuris suis TaxID=68888 RepID=A0A085MIN6_9BILA|nr:hypothetical protein M513_01967 [Trichuris suis]